MTTAAQTKLDLRVDELGYAHPLFGGALFGGADAAREFHGDRPLTLPDPVKVEAFARELGLTGHIHIRPFVHGGRVMPHKSYLGRTNAIARNRFVIYVDAGLPEDGTYESFSRVLRHELGHVKDLQERADRLGSLRAAVEEDQSEYARVTARRAWALEQGEEAYRSWLFDEYDQLPSERAANAVETAYADTILSH